MRKHLVNLGLVLGLFALLAAFLFLGASPGQAAGGVGVYLGMAVVAGYGTGYRDPSSLVAISAIKRGAEIRCIVSTVTHAVGDSTNSTWRIGSVPSDAILDPDSKYIYGATGISDLDIGFAYPNGGAVIDADNLVDGDDVSSAGSQTLFGHGTLTAANSQKRVWELAGLSSDPGGELDLIATQKAGTAAAATISYFIKYFKGA